MNPVIRGIVIYLFLMIVFRLSGKRTLAETTPFEFILLLIISEVTQQALVGEDFSLTTSIILITTLVGVDLLFSLIKQRWKGFEKVTDGSPLVVAANGKLLPQRAGKTRVSEEDILEAARNTQGLERMEQIKYAVLELDGTISIIPKKDSAD